MTSQIASPVGSRSRSSFTAGTGADRYYLPEGRDPYFVLSFIMPEARLQILSFSPFDRNLDAQTTITIDREADMIRLLRAAPFTRMAPLCQVIKINLWQPQLKVTLPSLRVQWEALQFN